MLQCACMTQEPCLFCQIGAGEEPAEVVYEDAEFIAFKDKFPQASIDVMVIPRKHWDKRKVEFERNDEFWGKLMERVGKVVRQLGLENEGYELQMNGGGRNHFWHEHVHVRGGAVN